jgi:hypothetical protein
MILTFLEQLEDDIHGMLCSKHIEYENEHEYFGLDSDRDTEEEVEAAIRLIPNVLSKV